MLLQIAADFFGHGYLHKSHQKSLFVPGSGHFKGCCDVSSLLLLAFLIERKESELSINALIHLKMVKSSEMSLSFQGATL